MEEQVIGPVVVSFGIEGDAFVVRLRTADGTPLGSYRITEEDKLDAVLEAIQSLSADDADDFGGAVETDAKAAFQADDFGGAADVAVVATSANDDFDGAGSAPPQATVQPVSRRDRGHMDSVSDLEMPELREQGDGWNVSFETPSGGVGELFASSVTTRAQFVDRIARLWPVDAEGDSDDTLRENAILRAQLERVVTMLLARMSVHNQGGVIDDAIALAGESKRKPAQKPETGGSVWVGLSLSAEDAAALAMEGGCPPGDLHVTLVYIGTYPELPADTGAKVRAAMESLGKRLRRVEVTTGKVGSFEPRDGKPRPWILHVESKGIHRLRAAAVEELAAVGVEVDKTFKTYKPHVTLSYGVEPTATYPERALSFDGVHVNDGETYKNIPVSFTGDELWPARGKAEELPPEPSAGMSLLDELLASAPSSRDAGDAAPPKGPTLAEVIVAAKGSPVTVLYRDSRGKAAMGAGVMKRAEIGADGSLSFDFGDYRKDTLPPRATVAYWNKELPAHARAGLYDLGGGVQDLLAYAHAHESKPTASGTLGDVAGVVLPAVNPFDGRVPPKVAARAWAWLRSESFKLSLVRTMLAAERHDAPRALLAAIADNLRMASVVVQTNAPDSREPTVKDSFAVVFRSQVEGLAAQLRAAYTGDGYPSREAGWEGWRVVAGSTPSADYADRVFGNEEGSLRELVRAEHHKHGEVFDAEESTAYREAVYGRALELSGDVVVALRFDPTAPVPFGGEAVPKQGGLNVEAFCEVPLFRLGTWAKFGESAAAGGKTPEGLLAEVRRALAPVAGRTKRERFACVASVPANTVPGLREASVYVGGADDASIYAIRGAVGRALDAIGIREPDGALDHYPLIRLGSPYVPGGSFVPFSVAVNGLSVRVGDAVYAYDLVDDGTPVLAPSLAPVKPVVGTIPAGTLVMVSKLDGGTRFGVVESYSDRAVNTAPGDRRYTIDDDGDVFKAPASRVVKADPAGEMPTVRGLFVSGQSDVSLPMPDAIKQARARAEAYVAEKGSARMDLSTLRSRAASFSALYVPTAKQAAETSGVAADRRAMTSFLFRGLASAPAVKAVLSDREADRERYARIAASVEATAAEVRALTSSEGKPLSDEDADSRAKWIDAQLKTLRWIRGMWLLDEPLPSPDLTRPAAPTGEAPEPAAALDPAATQSAPVPMASEDDVVLWGATASDPLWYLESHSFALIAWMNFAWLLRSDAGKYLARGMSAPYQSESRHGRDGKTWRLGSSKVAGDDAVLTTLRAGQAPLALFPRIGDGEALAAAERRFISLTQNFAEYERVKLVGEAMLKRPFRPFPRTLEVNPAGSVRFGVDIYSSGIRFVFFVESQRTPNKEGKLAAVRLETDGASDALGPWTIVDELLFSRTPLPPFDDKHIRAWMLPVAEVVAQTGYKRDREVQEIRTAHYMLVRAALFSRYPVPRAVMNDYPEMGAVYGVAEEDPTTTSDINDPADPDLILEHTAERGTNVKNARDTEDRTWNEAIKDLRMGFKWYVDRYYRQQSRGIRRPTIPLDDIANRLRAAGAKVKVVLDDVGKQEADRIYREHKGQNAARSAEKAQEALARAERLLGEAREAAGRATTANTERRGRMAKGKAERLQREAHEAADRARTLAHRSVAVGRAAHVRFDTLQSYAAARDSIRTAAEGVTSVRDLTAGVDEHRNAASSSPGLSFFATPSWLAARMVEEASIGAGDVVLEPSAGMGAIIDAVFAAGGKVVAVELSSDRSRFLAGKYDGVDAVQVINGDFMDLGANIPAAFDAVLINPPFSGAGNRSLFADHVERALSYLRPEGTIVAILPSSFVFSSDRRVVALREKLAGWGAAVEELPEGTFKDAGTMVRSVMVVASRPDDGSGGNRVAPEAPAPLPAPVGASAEASAAADGKPLSQASTPDAAARAAYEAPPEDWEPYNTELAKLLQGLKRDANAETIRQNYRGTGSQSYRRQLWTRFKGGAVMDLWLNAGRLEFGGVVGATGKSIAYGTMKPAEVYTKAVAFLRAWLKLDPLPEGPGPKGKPKADAPVVSSALASTLRAMGDEQAQEIRDAQHDYRSELSSDFGRVLAQTGSGAFDPNFSSFKHHGHDHGVARVMTNANTVAVVVPLLDVAKVDDPQDYLLWYSRLPARLDATAKESARSSGSTLQVIGESAGPEWGDREGGMGRLYVFGHFDEKGAASMVDSLTERLTDEGLKVSFVERAKLVPNRSAELAELASWREQYPFLLFRSVAPPEMDDIVARGCVTGRGNVFSGDDRDLVFFGTSLADTIHNGEDESRFVEGTLRELAAERHAAADARDAAEKRLDKLQEYTKPYEKLQREVIALRDRAQWAQKVYFMRLDERKQAYKASWIADGATSYVLEFFGLTGGKAYHEGSETARSMAPGTEVGFPRECVVKLDKLARVHVVLGMKVVRVVEAPVFLATHRASARPAEPPTPRKERSPAPVPETNIKGLKKSAQEQWATLLAGIEETYGVLSEAIEAVNGYDESELPEGSDDEDYIRIMAPLLETVRACLADYADAVATVAEFAESVRDQCEELFGEKTERWQDGEAGERMRSFIDAWESVAGLSDDPPSIEELEPDWKPEVDPDADEDSPPFRYELDAPDDVFSDMLESTPKTVDEVE